MAEHKLTYFALEGLAEPIRFLFSYGNIPFIDERIEIQNWLDAKSKYPFGKVPVLTYKGNVYMQHMPICKYVAGLVGLLGQDVFENMEIEGVVETISDLRMGLALWFYEQDQKIKASKKDDLFNKFIPSYLEGLEKIVKDNGGYFACKKLTWADVYAVGIQDLFNFYYGSDIVAKYPILKAHKEKILAIPSLKKWVEKRPKTDFEAMKKAIDEVKSKQSQ